MCRKYNSSTTFTQCAPEATKFGETRQKNGHYVVEDHLRSPIFVTNRKLIYEFILVINDEVYSPLRQYNTV